jgi:FtsP/CotA-like multicopper oxidase with cupredoxin domain
MAQQIPPNTANRSVDRLSGAALMALLVVAPAMAFAQPVPGGTLDPTTIPKYVTPLVIPPVMNGTGRDNQYEIAVRQLQQQILPGGIWDNLSGRNDGFPATTIWSYGPAADPQPDSSALGGGLGIAPAPNSQFNYPAYTIENEVDKKTKVDWINHLVADPWNCNWQRPAGAACNFIPHLLAIDRSLHWANPEQLPCTEPGKTIDCRPDPALSGTLLQQPYTGPVPMVTHVHGAHVTPESDGYPEAWWLPAASDIPAGYATLGTLTNQFGRSQTNRRPGVARFEYKNDQPSTTLWYHDHTLGMTRNNVYAGPAGFWLIRERRGGETGLVSGALPGPAPVAGEDLAQTNITGRGTYREIPVVIQDRSFNADGSLFYPANRAFFEGLGDGQNPRGNVPAGLQIPFVGDATPSDIAPIWNPEAFFNVMVVNGVSWPSHDVEPDLYRFRLLNGSNSRFLNLSLAALDAGGNVIGEVPFYQIGAEQSLLPQVIEVTTGFKTALPGDGTIPATKTAAVAPEEALLMGPAERADVIVDFGNLPAGTVAVRMLNTAPDAPFGGFPDVPADPGTTGQVMQFALVADTAAGEAATPPESLMLSLPQSRDPANGPAQAAPRDLALLEEVSQLVCATMQPDGTIVYDAAGIPDPATETCVDAGGALRDSVPFGPKAAVLGTNGSVGGTVELWADPITERPARNATETWELWNWSADAHPIHLHLVKFKVLGREPFDPVTGQLQGARAPELTETGWKDTVIAYPGEVTRVNATFDIAGLYVWHCHIVEHEDNEMMRPLCVADGPGCNVVP